MDYKRRISEIIGRADQIGVPLDDLCRAAEVHKSTFYRWRQEDANPRMRSMFAALDKMDAELTGREAAIVRSIADHNPAAIERAAQQEGAQP